MSSRALKKLSLCGDSGILKIEEDNDVDHSSCSSFNKEKFNRYNLVIIVEKVTLSLRTIFSRFTLCNLFQLNDDTQSESEIQEEETETTESVNVDENVHDTREGKRKKKKKKRRSSKQSYNAKSREYDNEVNFLVRF